MTISGGPQNMDDYERLGREKMAREAAKRAPDTQHQAPTPRTDAAWNEAVKIAQCGPHGATDWNNAAIHLGKHARQLERELAEAKQRLVEKSEFQVKLIERADRAERALHARAPVPSTVASKDAVLEACAKAYLQPEGDASLSDHDKAVNSGVLRCIQAIRAFAPSHEVPPLSADILTEANALILANEVRAAVLKGEVHPVNVERLACYVIASAAVSYISPTMPHPSVQIEIAAKAWSKHGLLAEDMGTAWNATLEAVSQAFAARLSGTVK